MSATEGSAIGAGLLVAFLALAVVAATPWTLRPRRPRLPPSGGVPTAATRRLRRSGGAAGEHVAVDAGVVLDLVRAALVAGSDVVSAVDAVGHALPPPHGESLRRAARSLRLGTGWDRAWPDGGPLAEALRAAWEDGVAPEPLLRHAAATVRQRRRALAREAAARLGVRLVLPLGLCLLPAFVLLGLVPVLIAAGLDLWGG